MRKIYIPFNSYKNGVGGPMTFMKNLQTEFDRLGFSYQDKAFWAKGMFFPILDNLTKIKIVKLFGGKVIQRLDGVNYSHTHSASHMQVNESMKNIYQNYADYVIFQSEYSKKQVFAMFGEKPQEQYSLICNGANQDIFYPSKYKKIHKKVRFITTGNFRNRDMLIPVIEALDVLQEKGYSFELNVFGPITIPEKDAILSKKYVVNKQSKELPEIADNLKSSDIFIYSHLNPPCPNSVIEAISCGLPIVGFDSGSMSELCYFNQELLAEVNDELLQKYEDFDNLKLAQKLELAINNFDQYKVRSLEHAEEYSMKVCAKKYLKVLSSVEPTKIRVFKLQTLYLKLFVRKIIRRA